MAHEVYDPETGDITRNGKSVVKGPGADGYLRCNRDNVTWLAHRLAFVLRTGHPPVNDIDHINGDKTDNRWVNLRDISTSCNGLNRGAANANSSTGLIGVAYCPKDRGLKKYRMRLRIGGVVVASSRWSTAEEAASAYLSARSQYVPEYSTRLEGMGEGTRT